jgi:hypothetical protein
LQAAAGASPSNPTPPTTTRKPSKHPTRQTHPQPTIIDATFVPPDMRHPRSDSLSHVPAPSTNGRHPP